MAAIRIHALSVPKDKVSNYPEVINPGGQTIHHIKPDMVNIMDTGHGAAPSKYST
jgi:hypothetical protein